MGGVATGIQSDECQGGTKRGKQYIDNRGLNALTNQKLKKPNLPEKLEKRNPRGKDTRKLNGGGGKKDP